MEKLHLGAFDQPIEGWLNTDITPHIFITRVPGLPMLLSIAGVLPPERLRQHREGTFRQLRYLNAAKRFPFRSNSFDRIYSSHMLEHLPREAAENCLRECLRVMRPDAVLRVAVPDLDTMIATYDPGQVEAWLEDLLEVRRRGAKNRHWWHYNEQSLRTLLNEIGYRESYRCEHNVSLHTELSGIDCRPGSLVIEARK